MEEKRNYVIYAPNYDDVERVVKMTRAQTDAIRWFVNYFDTNCVVELAENYNGEEI